MAALLHIDISRLKSEVYFKTSRSGGAGGQNVNKVETKVLLIWDFRFSSLFSYEQKEIIADKLENRIDKEGRLSLSCEESRSQLRNKELVVDRLVSLLRETLKKERKRIPTKPSRSAIRKRVEAKKKQSEIKKNRKRIDPRRLTIIIWMLFFSQSMISQKLVAPRLYSEIIMGAKLDSLKKQLDSNKRLIPKYELATLTALQHYPELRLTKIVLETKNLKTTMVARPRGLNVFRRKGKRKYVIYINDTEQVKVPVDSASFNAQVGVIGHELAHIVDYETKSSLSILGNGIGYVSHNFRRKFETATDQRTIDHGLGWQAFDWSFFVYHYKNVPQDYLDYKKSIYMGYDSIEKQIKGN